MSKAEMDREPGLGRGRAKKILRRSAEAGATSNIAKVSASHGPRGRPYQRTQHREPSSCRGPAVNRLPLTRQTQRKEVDVVDNYRMDSLRKVLRVGQIQRSTSCSELNRKR